MSKFKKTFQITAIVLVAGVSLAFVKTDFNKYFEIAKNIEIFTNLYKELNSHYVDELDPAKLMRTGVDAMVESLDPYTNYISESEIENYRYMTEGKYNGIGAQVRKIGDRILITEPYKDSPAVNAGLKAGDVLIEIDGRSLEGKSGEDIGNLLKGFPGTEVDLTIERMGEDKPINIKLVRGEVKIPNVPYSGMVGENVGYVALTTFTREAGRNVGNAVRDLLKENEDMKGVILDLRGNGGGLLSEAVNVSNVFIPNGELVVTTRGKLKEEDRSFATRGNPVNGEIPVVVLINKSSASASEIVSGVLQDYDRAVLLGQRSYGKGLVQNTKDIGYNSKLKLTTAKYYIPSGRCIQSVRYDGGEPVDIPDGDRAVFTTRNGREVLDGGGVKPDVNLPSYTDIEIIKYLDKANLIFDFVTEYCLNLEAVASPEEYQFTDFDAFLSFLEKKEYAFSTASEKALKTLMENAEKDGFDEKIKDNIEAIRKEISQEKKAELLKNKEGIEDLIEKEIIGRFYYEEGKIKIGLRNDKEISEAVEILNDKEQYEKILTK